MPQQGKGVPRMPLLSRVARVSQDYRAARASVALLGGISGALSPLAATAQDAKAPVQTAQLAVPAVKASFVKPPMALEPHCPIITLAFEEAGVRGEFKSQITKWAGAGCKGDIPVPQAGDRHNIQRFNAVASILQNGGKIVLTP